MSRNSLEQIMDIKEVAGALGCKEATIRSWLWRKAGGDSTPDFPEPLGKKSGAWFWDRRTVAKFLTEVGAQDGAA